MLKMKGFWGWGAAVIALALAVQRPWWILWQVFAGGLLQDDYVDQIRIVEGLERARTFSDTLAWWSGPWVESPGVNFYRPLTSLVWWLQFHAFGGREQAGPGFMLVHLGLHLSSVFVCWGFCAVSWSTRWRWAR